MKSITILLILNCLILIGAGHGFGPLILIEFLVFSPSFTKSYEINFLGSYDQKIIPFSILSIIPQILLLTSFFIKAHFKFKLIIFSVIFMIINLIYFTFDFIDSGLSKFTLISSIPFLICATFVLIKIFSNIKLRND
ncbi:MULTISPECIES: hypothetical protein [Epilithonimonas]|uniref:DUF4293 family protein n=1 Tax=Epilithonimonas hominis TaxID=420404 RepID=A0A3N0XBH9_9FLAO|nr:MULTISPECIES: hypothetical protein [Epilithonimonas]ROI14724.1 hypothetical protein EGH73_01650 [Epilithonimonas hominis]HAP94823.1 hypothetical protein [Chryseobacterium sp.]